MEQSFRAELTGERTKLELAEQAMLSDANSLSEPLSEMLKQTIACNKALNDETSSLRNQLSQLKAKSSMGCQRLDNHLIAAKYKADELDAD